MTRLRANDFLATNGGTLSSTFGVRFSRTLLYKRRRPRSRARFIPANGDRGGAPGHVRPSSGSSWDVGYSSSARDRRRLPGVPRFTLAEIRPDVNVILTEADQSAQGTYTRPGRHTGPCQRSTGQGHIANTRVSPRRTWSRRCGRCPRPPGKRKLSAWSEQQPFGHLHAVAREETGRLLDRAGQRKAETHPHSIHHADRGTCALPIFVAAGRGDSERGAYSTRRGSESYISFPCRNQPHRSFIV